MELKKGKVNWNHLRQQHLNRWEPCKGCRQSKTLMTEPLTSRTKELQAMSRQKLQGLWDCWQTAQLLESKCFNSRLTQPEDCRICRGIIACQCSAPACERCITLGRAFLKTKDLESMRVAGRILLVASSTLGVIP